MNEKLLQSFLNEEGSDHVRKLLLGRISECRTGAGLPRATYYRHLNSRSRETADCELRDQLQRICLKHPFYGYRRVTATIQRKGMIVNARKCSGSCARTIFSHSARRHS